MCRSTEVVATLYLLFQYLTMVAIKLYNVKKKSNCLKEGRVRNTTFQEQTVRMYRLCNLLLNYGLKSDMLRAELTCQRFQSFHSC